MTVRDKGKTMRPSTLAVAACLLGLVIAATGCGRAVGKESGVERSAVVRGRLVDRTGTPSAGDRVKLLEWVRGNTSEAKVVETAASRKTTSGEDGRFSFADVAPGEYALTPDMGPPMKNKDGVFIVIKVNAGKDIIDLGDIILQ
jgi:hypothetical protein